MGNSRLSVGDTLKISTENITHFECRIYHKDTHLDRVYPDLLVLHRQASMQKYSFRIARIRKNTKPRMDDDFLMNVFLILGEIFLFI